MSSVVAGGTTVDLGEDGRQGVVWCAGLGRPAAMAGDAQVVQ